MGLFLSGTGRDAAAAGKSRSSPNEHRRVSRELLRVAAAQRRPWRPRNCWACPSTRGAMTCWLFAPAATALDAAEACHSVIRPTLPTASTAVLFFHYHASIQRAMSQARRSAGAGQGRCAASTPGRGLPAALGGDARCPSSRGRRPDGESSASGSGCSPASTSRACRRGWSPTSSETRVNLAGSRRHPGRYRPKGAAVQGRTGPPGPAARRSRESVTSVTRRRG